MTGTQYLEERRKMFEAAVQARATAVSDEEEAEADRIVVGFRLGLVLEEVL